VCVCHPRLIKASAVKEEAEAEASHRISTAFKRSQSEAVSPSMHHLHAKRYESHQHIVHPYTPVFLKQGHESLQVHSSILRASTPAHGDTRTDLTQNGCCTVGRTKITTLPYATPSFHVFHYLISSSKYAVFLMLTVIVQRAHTVLRTPYIARTRTSLDRFSKSLDKQLPFTGDLGHTEQRATRADGASCVTW
jgi:hypothetical protein